MTKNIASYSYNVMVCLHAKAITQQQLTIV